MPRSMGGGGGGSSSGGRSMGGGGRSTSSRSFSGSGRSRSTGGGGSTRHVGGSSGSNFSRPGGGYRPGGGHPSGGFHPGGIGRNCPPPPPPRHYHNRPRYYGGAPVAGGTGCGCGTFIWLIIIIAILSSLINFSGVKNTQNGDTYSSASTQKLNKEKYEGAVCTTHGYYIDNSDPDKGGFIDRTNESTLIAGFKDFYSKTGVFPFLYIVETLPDGYSNAQTYSEDLYTELFTENDKVIEGNLLILYVADEQYGEGDYYLTGGLNIGATIDSSAIDLICAEINSRWDSGDLAIIMGNGLKAAGTSIMAKSNTKTIAIAIIIGLVIIIVILILFKWWKSAKAQKNKEQEDLERVLNTPLETFGTSSTDDLTKKYEDE